MARKTIYYECRDNFQFNSSLVVNSKLNSTRTVPRRIWKICVQIRPKYQRPRAGDPRTFIINQATWLGTFRNKLMGGGLPNPSSQSSIIYTEYLESKRVSLYEQIDLKKVVIQSFIKILKSSLSPRRKIATQSLQKSI